MLDDRKAAILRAVVEEYIQTAQPVGSGHVARIPGLSVSPATVRNEMGVLEREGYLSQPHTSAGRVPTDKGYRFFVDSLTPGTRLEPAQSQLVRSFFATTHGELEKLLADTSHLLSGITDYAAVVVSPEGDPSRVRSVQIVGLAPQIVLAVAVVANGTVHKRTLELTDEASEAQLAAATAHLSAHLVGEPLGTLRPVAPSGDDAVDCIADAAARVFAHGPLGVEEHPQVFVGGAARMASAFDAVGTIRRVLDILEQQIVLISLIRDVLDRGLSVAIGAELGVQPLAECSVVVAPYEIEGERAGTVGILGPTRMHYEQTLAAVAVVSKRLSRALSEGLEGG